MADTKTTDGAEKKPRAPRKPRAKKETVEKQETVVVETKVEQEVVETKPEQEEKESVTAKTDVEETVETKGEPGDNTEAPTVAPVVEPVVELVEPTSVQTIEEPVETAQTEEKESLVPAGFRPILRPTSVGGKAVGFIPCPKHVFDIVTTEGWEDTVDTSKHRVQLLSILYWKERNGEAKVRCNSSSKFAEVK